MLTPEQIATQLAQFKDNKGPQDRIRRVKSLPSPLQKIGLFLSEKKSYWSMTEKEKIRYFERGEEIKTLLTKLDFSQRKQLFEALFPNFADQALATWNLINLLPYTSGLNRRPFRITHQTPINRIYYWLKRLISMTEDYLYQDVEWFAAWSPYILYSDSNCLGLLFAGAISVDGEIGHKVYDILVASAEGTHEIGRMGRHVVTGLLCSTRKDGWKYIEQLLLAAQREEGLRQVILESVDESQCDAFKGILRLILDQNLSRFSATIRSFAVWFGLPFDEINQKYVNDTLAKVLSFLDSSELCNQAIRNGTDEEIYFALWTIAFVDAQKALPIALDLAQETNPNHRFVATFFLTQMDLEKSVYALIQLIKDEDLRICACALTGFNDLHSLYSPLIESDLFENLESLFLRLEHEKPNPKPLVWNGLKIELNQKIVASLILKCLGSRSPNRLIRYIPQMDSYNRSLMVGLLDDFAKKDEEARHVLCSLAGDQSPMVRESAIKALRSYILAESEITQMESLLTRKSADLRRAVIQLLYGVSDKALMGCISRLLLYKNENQRLAGLELIQECKKSNRCTKECSEITNLLNEKTNLSKDENRWVENISDISLSQYKLSNAFGLINPKNQTKPSKPSLSFSQKVKIRKVKLGSSAAIECLKSLHQLITLHQNELIEVEVYNGSKTDLLTNLSNQFPSPDPNSKFEQDTARLPLKEVWGNWWFNRNKQCKDADGLELIRALAILQLVTYQYGFGMKRTAKITSDLRIFFGINGDIPLDYDKTMGSILQWLILLHPVHSETDFILDAVDASLSKIPLFEVLDEKKQFERKVRTLSQQKLVYIQIAHWHRAFNLKKWEPQHHNRLWAWVRWLQEPSPGKTRLNSFRNFSYFGNLHKDYSQIKDVLYTITTNSASRDDLYSFFFERQEYQSTHYHWIHEFSGKKPHPLFQQFPFLQEMIETVRNRILAIEIKRGDLPTEASAVCLSLKSVPGMKVLFELLTALGKLRFNRGWSFGLDRAGVLSHLIRRCYPLPNENVTDFIELVKQMQISESRLIELAVYAPQWAPFVEKTLNWPKLKESVFWLYAHTKDRQWTVEQEFREEWTAQISEFTPLTADQLLDGAVDVAWFQSLYKELGNQHWETLYKAAEFASGGSGHTRARIFADAMTGKLTTQEIINRIIEKRHQDSVRALGLVPLDDLQDKKNQILDRYQVLQEFLRTSKQFGSQRKASESLAVEIGMVNLARSAGYPDPQRLEWAMEIEEIKDLADGPINVQIDKTKVTLQINNLGEPEINALKGSTTLSSIPSNIRNEARVKKLYERKQQLSRQVSRMRQSLERSMCQGDFFIGTEIRNLFSHPMLREMVGQLVFSSADGMGYPINNGTALLHHTGKLLPIKSEDCLKIAHPIDLLKSKEWHEWQRECFLAERIQPFKQVFRELYVLTQTEITEGNQSRRYAGQQINPRQALALFGHRGWIANPEEGVQKTFHSAEISVHVNFLQGAFTPIEVEGLTLESVYFTNRGNWTPLALETIPDRLFSEVMRDLDLVVSVAHASGVDPESSASSIDARLTLIKETCHLLKIENVNPNGNFVVINGKLATYNVHLGSGVVHKQPGGALCIIPVHSQHRGRLFLPFVDNDPKTAEIISKVILLAQDNQIKDPSILEQIL
ncbi:MAG: hypothetical protein C0410_04540 [Anaerolinea sp.]|nr:hypothetical protein [Anaerolinea sp.]